MAYNMYITHIHKCYQNPNQENSQISTWVGVYLPCYGEISLTLPFTWFAWLFLYSSTNEQKPLNSNINKNSQDFTTKARILTLGSLRLIFYPKSLQKPLGTPWSKEREVERKQERRVALEKKSEGFAMT